MRNLETIIHDRKNIKTKNENFVLIKVKGKYVTCVDNKLNHAWIIINMLILTNIFQFYKEEKLNRLKIKKKIK